ncbi:MAG: Uma2 family endonuclease [Cyanobacteria bacterium P01_C01_bin.69]
MAQSKVKAILPSGSELPDSDDTPVDNEEENLLPNLLLFVLNHIWKTHKNWYFGVDMGVYHATGENPRVPVVPDAFLSVGVARFRNDDTRRSYVVWEEEGIVPVLAIELVSWLPGGEYDRKLEIYRKLGILYYVIYNPEYWRRDRHRPFEVYKLIDGEYQLQQGEPFWMPEAGLGLGRYQGDISGQYQEILCWFEADGTRILMMEERSEKFQGEAEKFQGEAEKFQNKAERLAARLRELGEDPTAI